MEHTFSHHTAYRTLLAAGLGPEIAIPVLREVQKWIACNGPEWAVSRLKNLKAAYLQKIAGKTLNSHDTGFRMHSDGTPYGVMRCLFRLGGYRGTVRAINAMMVYTGITLTRVTKGQWKKFHNSVVNPEPLKRMPVIPVTKEMVWSMVDCWKNASYTPLEEWCSTSKRAPFTKVGVSGLITKPESESSPREHLEVLKDPDHKDLLASFPIPFEKSTGITVGADVRRRAGFTRCPPTFVGRIGFIQERGAKLRAIANPFRVHQAALSRLGNALFDFLRTACPWDCTFEQDRGVRRVQEVLGSGKTVYSVDLSDATNQFPLGLQMQTLTSLLQPLLRQVQNASVLDEVSQSLDLFAAISRAKWHVPNREDISTASGGVFSIRWSKGQPLGLYPSFAAFAITHGLLLKAIEDDLGLQQTFVVLGDDVAVFHPEVHRKYLEVLDDLGCPVSTLKSLSSGNVAEFAGRLVTREGLLPVEKWKGFSTSDPLSVVKQWGLAGLVLAPKELRKYLEVFSAIPEPVGFGFNPKGIPLEKRMANVDSLFWEDAEPLNIDSEVSRERQLDLEEVFQPYLTKYTIHREMGSPTYWPNRPTTEIMRQIEHVNAVLRDCKVYEVSDHYLQLRDSLVQYLRAPSGRSTWERKGTTRLSRIIEIVKRVWQQT